MNSSNPIVAHNVQDWRNQRGLTARETEVQRIFDERSAHEKEMEAFNASRDARFDKVRRCGGKVPANAVDVTFRRGSDGRGGRVHWEFKLSPFGAVSSVCATV